MDRSVARCVIIVQGRNQAHLGWCAQVKFGSRPASNASSISRSKSTNSAGPGCFVRFRSHVRIGNSQSHVQGPMILGGGRRWVAGTCGLAMFLPKFGFGQSDENSVPHDKSVHGNFVHGNFNEKSWTRQGFTVHRSCGRTMSNVALIPVWAPRSGRSIHQACCFFL